MERIPIDEFISRMSDSPAFDVRTPKEFAAGHIPGAINLPLFTNEERAVVGTIYKKNGRDKAVFTGLDIVGPKMRWLAETMRKNARNGRVLVHCWRGGMRSGSTAWLAEFCGIEAAVLEKGYKAYRNWCIDRFNEDRRIVILSGRTGTGKTEILGHLSRMGEEVIDLERLAHHKGSAFGALGENKQPTQEQFENELGMALSRLRPGARVWIEDESREIGYCSVPDPFFKKMRSAPVIRVDTPRARRTEYLYTIYGSFNPYFLAEAAKKIERRLGPDRTRACLAAIESGDIKTAIDISLEYYDKGYDMSFAKRNGESPVIPLASSDENSFEDIARQLVACADSHGF
ncbi:MAG TPA: tRNA 2-selenouridine(34) synthase MnmH [Spirochaetota bacterium]|nr:tRNA 2-selenouridine(34) synthase MnmH [Spirochaetota bacterium]